MLIALVLPAICTGGAAFMARFFVALLQEGRATSPRRVAYVVTPIHSSEIENAGQALKPGRLLGWRPRPDSPAKVMRKASRKHA